jgi:hypothetical protein
MHDIFFLKKLFGGFPLNLYFYYCIIKLKIDLEKLNWVYDVGHWFGG